MYAYLKSKTTFDYFVSFDNALVKLGAHFIPVPSQGRAECRGLVMAGAVALNLSAPGSAPTLSALPSAHLAMGHFNVPDCQVITAKKILKRWCAEKVSIGGPGILKSYARP